MKQKVCILLRSIRLELFLLLISAPPLLSAQEGDARMTRDSVPVKLESTFQLPSLNYFPGERVARPLYPSEPIGELPDFSLKGEMNLPYHINPSPTFRGDYRTDGVLKQFSHGVLFGSGGQTSLPGIGSFNNATLGYKYAFNEKLTLQLRANAMKINMTHFSGQAFNVSGTLLYRPSERIAFKAFGSYDIGNSYGMSTPFYGVTMSADLSDRFGVEMGVQRYYDVMRGRWETVPIVSPYYRFDKFTLGVDVGGLLYEILREAVFREQEDSGPTIAPPRFFMPIR